MHMADALISPVIGGTMWAATIALGGIAGKKIQIEMDDKKIPLMGIMGAFIFAAQMINFSIPGTGSSGHIGGGLILSVILGPWAGFLVMSSVLAIQSLFFADGGLLAYGCNVVNLGFFTCFLAYPLIYKKIIKENASFLRHSAAAIVAAVVGLQMGSIAVVLETLLSGKTELPFGTFVLLMQPIHLAIGLVEGLVSAAVIAYVRKSSPTLLETTRKGNPIAASPINKVIIGIAATAVIVGACVSWFASSHPDGLEWAMQKVAGTTELEASGSAYQTATAIQETTAFLPDYNFKAPVGSHEESSPAWPSFSMGTSVSGIIGAGLTLFLAGLVGFVIRMVIVFRRKRTE